MKIVKIISVEDTRTYDLQITNTGERWLAIPGSGKENECARCGRMHEVHATVELEDGKLIVVGTGCMHAESSDIKSRIKSATSAAKTLARLQAEYDHVLKQQQFFYATEAEIIQEGFPEIIKVQEPGSFARTGEIRWVYYCGTGKCWADSPDDRERYECVTDSYLRDELRKRTGFHYCPSSVDLKRRLERARKKVNSIQ